MNYLSFRQNASWNHFELSCTIFKRMRAQVKDTSNISDFFSDLCWFEIKIFYDCWFSLLLQNGEIIFQMTVFANYKSPFVFFNQDDFYGRIHD